MGEKNIWHFSHKSNLNCNGGFETNLHLYGKEVIKNNKLIFLPEINLGTALKMNMFGHELREDILTWVEYNDLGVLYTTVFEKNNYKYNWIDNETKINNFIPDSLIKIKDKEVAIEICVTHSVDETKRDKVKNIDIDMLEIYLNPKEIQNKMENTNFKLDEYILLETDRKWIHKTNSDYFTKRIQNIIYNTKKPVLNYNYTSKKLIEKIQHTFLCCPLCKGNLVERNGKKGKFYGCQNFPKCNFTKGKLYDVCCPKCGKKLHKLDGKYGWYLGHSDYECKYSKKLNKDEEVFL